MDSDENYAIFRECLSNAIVARSEDKPKPARRKPKSKRVTTTTSVSKGRSDPEELAEFVDVHPPSQPDQKKTGPVQKGHNAN
jgi:hypothetical protein